jgi:hypothetical protein
MLLPGDRVATPMGPGRVVEDRQSWDMGVHDEAWHHGEGGPPRWVTVRLDGDGGEIVFSYGEITAVPVGGSCDP